MRKSFRILQIVLFAANLFLFCAHSQPVANLISEPESNLGAVKVGSTLTHVFVISNHGDEKLIIKAAETSCGCQILSLPLSVPPSEECTVHVLHQVESLGKRNEIVTLSTNDPNNQTLSHMFEYTGVREIYAVPQELELGNNQKPRDSLSVSIQSLDGSQFRITEASVSNTCIKLVADSNARDSPASKHTYKIQVSPIVTSDLKESITFRTDSVTVPLVEMPVTGLVEGQYRIEPDELVIGIAKPGEIIKKYARITSNASVPFVIAQDIVHCEGIEIIKGDSSETQNPRTSWDLLFTFCAPDSAGVWTKNWPLTAVTESNDKALIVVSASGICVQ